MTPTATQTLNAVLQCSDRCRTSPCAVLQELGIDNSGPVFRTKANCLRVCCKGPIAVVFPEQVGTHRAP